ncbi:MAG: hypothetical protein GC191_06785 [Azospirillum sp.]|nr:hypothetical protein [Azospirillum sp.]
MTAGETAPMTTLTPVSAPRRRRQAGWYIPWLFVGAFLVVVSVNGLLTWFALSTFSGLTTEHAYDEGVAYNRALAGAEAQAQRAWQVELGFTDFGQHHGRIDLTLRDHDGKPLSGAAVAAVFVRPASQGADVGVALVERGAGHYRGEAALPLPGVWDIHLTAGHAKGDYQTVHRVVVKE